MHITAEMILAVEQGEMPEEELFDIRIEHLATLCPGCAEVLAAHKARLARGDDQIASRRALKTDFYVHALQSRWSATDDHPPHDHGQP